MRAVLQGKSQVSNNPLAGTDSAKAWINTLPAADPKTALDAINQALAILIEGDFAGAGASNTLQVVENHRKQMAGFSQDMSSRYAGKPLPLSKAQRSAFESNITLAWTLAYVYYSLIESSQRASSGLGRQAALVHQRALFWTARGMEEHLRARQGFADEDWDLAQTVLQSAAELELADDKVRDDLHPAGKSSVAASYVRLLLLHMVGGRSLSMRELECAFEMAHYFEDEADLSYTVADSHDTVTQAPDPDEENTERVIQTGTLVHFLELAALSRELRSRQEALGKGKMFDRPALANPPAPPALKGLLSKLRTAWCSPANQRQSPRRRSDDQVYAAFEPVAIYGLMKRRPYVPPEMPKVYKHHEVANIYLRQGDGQRSGQQMHTQETWNQVKPQLEVWQAQDQSDTGMRLTRAADGTPMRQGQLMALRLGESGGAVVAVVRWAVQTKVADAAQGPNSDGGDGAAADAAAHVVEVGVQLLPGLARAGAVRYMGTRAMTQATAGKPVATPVLILDNFTRVAPRADGAAAAPKRAPAQEREIQTLAFDELPTLDTDIGVPDDAADTHIGPPRYSAEATILLPASWASEDEVIEFVDGTITVRLRVGAVNQRYGDIERVHFQTVD